MLIWKKSSLSFIVFPSWNISYMMKFTSNKMFFHLESMIILSTRGLYKMFKLSMTRLLSYCPLIVVFKFYINFLNKLKEF